MEKFGKKSRNEINGAKQVNYKLMNVKEKIVKKKKHNRKREEKEKVRNNTNLEKEQVGKKARSLVGEIVLRPNHR